MTKDLGKSVILFVLLTVGAFQPLFAQEAPLKALADEISERKFCLYPSTLRMLNLEKNEDLNEVANSIKKVLIYQLSISPGDPELKELSEKYLKKGFEEYARVYGGKQSLMILGKGNEAYVGYAGDKRNLFAFYLEGELRWEKVPKLINTLQSNDLINMLQIGQDLVEVEIE